MLYGELGRYPIEIVIKTRLIGLWVRIITGKQDKFVNLMYQKLIQTGAHKFKWTKQVQNILQEAGRNDLWLNQNAYIPKISHQTIKKTLIDLFTQKWQSSLEQSSKGRNYSLLKSEPSFEEYLKIIPRALFIPLIKYRTANHFLPVETLRWRGIDISERKCTLCDKSDTADEFHYLFLCNHFEESRKLYLNPYKAVVGGTAGPAMAGPLFWLTKFFFFFAG